MSTLSSTYYNRLIGHAGASFANLVHIWERIEDNLKTGKIKDYQTLVNQSPNGAGSSTKRKFPNKKNDKMTRKFIPSLHQSADVPSAPPPPHPPAHRTLYPPPPVYHSP